MLSRVLCEVQHFRFPTLHQPQSISKQLAIRDVTSKIYPLTYLMETGVWSLCYFKTIIFKTGASFTRYWTCQMCFRLHNNVNYLLFSDNKNQHLLLRPNLYWTGVRAPLGIYLPTFFCFFFRYMTTMVLINGYPTYLIK